LLEGSVTGEGSFLSRLTIRFLEIFAAGLATAVSGYLIAHFGGYLAAPTPAAVVQQPAAIQQGVQSGSAPPVVKETLPAAAVSQPNTADQRPSSNGAGAKGRDTGRDAGRDTARDTARDTSETKPREAVRSPAVPSFEARMRAALEKAGPEKASPANPASSEASRHQAAVPVDALSRPSNTAPRPVDAPTGSIANAPPPDDSASRAPVAPLPSAPAVENTAAQSPAIALPPPATVEIKSQPVASVDPNQPAAPAAQPPDNDQDDGPFAAITKRLHINKLLTGQPPPRPPMPVGNE
jgi:hypothetical protein